MCLSVYVLYKNKTKKLEKNNVLTNKILKQQQLILVFDNKL